MRHPASDSLVKRAMVREQRVIRISGIDAFQAQIAPAPIDQGLKAFAQATPHARFALIEGARTKQPYRSRGAPV
jgi:hypothetical protein